MVLFNIAHTAIEVLLQAQGRSKVGISLRLAVRHQACDLATTNQLTMGT